MLLPSSTYTLSEGVRYGRSTCTSPGLRRLRAAGRLGGPVAGPYDFLPITNPDARPVFNHPAYPAASQPLDHVHAGAPPAFLGAAKTDMLVNPQRNTGGLAARLQADGVPVTLKMYDRVNHVTLAGSFAWPLRWLAPVLDDVSAFVSRQDLARPCLRLGWVGAGLRYLSLSGLCVFGGWLARLAHALDSRFRGNDGTKSDSERSDA